MEGVLFLVMVESGEAVACMTSKHAGRFGRRCGRHGGVDNGGRIGADTLGCHLPRVCPAWGALQSAVRPVRIPAQLLDPSERAAAG